MRRYYEDYDYDCDDTPECAGVDDDCEGCSSCTDTATTSRVVIARAPRSAVGIARRAKSGIRPGDTIVVTTGFDFQKGGGRFNYFRSEQLRERGPAWSPEEREFFTINKETSRRQWGIEKLREVLEKGREFEERTGLALQWFHGSRDRVEQKIAEHDERTRRDAQDRAEWEGVMAARTGDEVSFRGTRYTKGKGWTKAIYHSETEYYGHLCDASIVWQYKLVPVEEGKSLLVQDNRMPPQSFGPVSCGGVA